MKCSTEKLPLAIRLLFCILVKYEAVIHHESAVQACRGSA
jgi:hypothetical protein